MNTPSINVELSWTVNLFMTFGINMKDKNRNNVEYFDFKSLKKDKPKKTEFCSFSHTNPIASKLFKFVHNKLSKFKPEDLS